MEYTQLRNPLPDDRTLLLFETLHVSADRVSEIVHRMSGCEIGYWEFLDITQRLIEERQNKSVRIPTTENEAAAMVVLGMEYLKTHAPHRLTPEARTELKCLKPHCKNDAQPRSNYCIECNPYKKKKS